MGFHELLGSLLVAQRVAGRGEINHGFLDPYSLVHVLVGVVTAIYGLGLGVATAIAVGWEVIEHLAKNLAPTAFPHPTQDTLANSVGDVLSTACGWAIAVFVKTRSRDRHRGR